MTIFAISSINISTVMTATLEKDKNQYRYLLLHYLCWSVVIIAPLFFHSSEDSWAMVWTRYARSLGGTLSCMLVFYLNYLWFVPRFMIKKKDWKMFLLINLFVLVLGVFFVDVWRWMCHQVLPTIVNVSQNMPKKRPPRASGYFYLVVCETWCFLATAHYHDCCCKDRCCLDESLSSHLCIFCVIFTSCLL